MRPLAFATLVMLGLASSCSSPDAEAEMPCGPNGECPTGFTCVPSTNRCTKSASVALDSGLADSAQADAALADAPLADAGAPPDTPAPADAPAPPDAASPDARTCTRGINACGATCMAVASCGTDNYLVDCACASMTCTCKKNGETTSTPPGACSALDQGKNPWADVCGFPVSF